MKFRQVVGQNVWSVVYEKAIRPDGSLFFPQRLSKEFLESQRRIQGSYIFAHQYQNEIIPGDDQDFKKEWIKYYDQLPAQTNTFAFIDPAISLENEACYTALAVVEITQGNEWFVKMAQRLRITATQTVDLIFKVHEKFKPQVIGVEAVAYQTALMHFCAEEMRRRGIVIPLKDIRRGPDKSKEMRIRSLVPRFEWGQIYLKKGLVDLEDELLKFPRGSFNDLLDALASIEDIAYPHTPKKKRLHELHPNDPGYEREYIRRLKTQEGSSSQDF